MLVLGRTGLTSEEPSVLTEPASVVLNGERAPRFVWKAGSAHRVRLINITPDDIFSVALQTADGPVMWTPVAKDGAPLPAAAVRRRAGAPDDCRRRDLRLRFTRHPRAARRCGSKYARTGGKWQVQGHVTVR